MRIFRSKQPKAMTDLDVIERIGKALGVELKKSDDLFLEEGYTLDQNGRVTGIGLNRCEIKGLGPIIGLLRALTNLTELELSSNQLSDLTPLGALTNLTRLDLRHNQLSDLAPLRALTNLTELDLRHNQLSDLAPLRALTNLTELDLGFNQLSDLAPLRALTNLTRLYLTRNQIEDLSPLKHSKQIEMLWLEENRITDLSPLKELKQIRLLVLNGNKIDDISPLKELKGLDTLRLSHNPIKELPAWITDFDMEIAWNDSISVGSMSFYDNPLEIPPPEIVKQGKAAIRNYFEQLREQEEDYLFEAKLLIVGEPGAGKTSMAWKLEDADCDLPVEEDTTKGIDVRQYYFPLRQEDFKAFKKHPERLENRRFRLNLWDFGGQEIYKATHRFFLSKRSLYALVADSRNEDTDFNYWLHIVEMFGGDSPLLIVLNEKYQRRRDIEIPAMQARFANISQVLEVDFADPDPSRLHTLERAVKYHVSQLPHIGSPVPARWMSVREALEQDERNTIGLQDYLGICKRNGIAKEQDARVLSRYFHDIGVFLHFQEDELLNNTLFLQPNWATHAVYKILDHPLLKQQHGRFNKADADTIWDADEYAALRDQLLRLMQNFFLTYRIADSGEYIVPERLPANRPEYPWDEHDNLVLRYAYAVFMPKGILSQFIVHMYRRISNHDHVWKRGVVLEREDSRAEIIENYYDRSIEIRIAGKDKRDFMTLITEQFDRINDQYGKMQVDKLIPCNCDECRSSGDPHFFYYKELRRRMDKGRQEDECDRSYEQVNVRGLIDDVINPAPRGVDAREMLAQQKNPQPEEASAMSEDYIDFELHIAPEGQATASSPQGEVTARIATQVPRDIRLALRLIEKGETEAALLQRVGESFYDWLFPHAIHTHLHQTEAVARDRKQKVRLRLRIEAENIASQPLEFLYRTMGDYFLAVNPATVLSRYLNLPLPPGRVRRREGSLHMLVIIADPTDQTRLDPDAWEAIIREALGQPLANGQIRLETVKRATRKEIRNALLRQEPDIIQFVGHGIYENGKGHLALVDEQTNATWLVDDKGFADLYRGHDDNLGLIGMATCESARSDNPQAFLGIAPQLVRLGIPAVVAMQYAVRIETAKTFLEDFYTAAAARKPIDWAVQSARKAVSLEYGTDNREFATPVLYMRAEDGNVF